MFVYLSYINNGLGVSGGCDIPRLVFYCMRIVMHDGCVRLLLKCWVVKRRTISFSSVMSHFIALH